jgi:hypothetical protein
MSIVLTQLLANGEVSAFNKEHRNDPLPLAIPQ